MTALPSQVSDLPEVVAEHMRKELLRLVVVGSVDDGKSTLIGRMLYDTHALPDDQIAAVRKASAGGAIDFSLFTDGLRAEREQGITIDVAYRYFTTEHRQLIVADTPGHLQYTRNMATGASTADAALILVDARLGVLSQTRRHTYLASLLGIPYIAVAINKMDILDFDRTVFDRIGNTFLSFAKTLGFEKVQLFPVSAVQGDNVTRPSERTPWHDGGTLLAWLESLPSARRLDKLPARLPVQLTLRPNMDYRAFAGQIASGSFKVGDEVAVMPSGRRSKVTSLDTFDGQLRQESAPFSVALRLADEIDVTRGDVIVRTDQQQPALLERLEANLVWFSEKPMALSQRYLLKHCERYISAHVDEIVYRKELETLTEVPAETLALNEIGQVRITCRRPLICDPYRENRSTGAFILIDPLTNDTVAAGMIIGPVRDDGDTKPRSTISPAERATRLGQRGMVALLPPGGEAAQVAYGLERALFERGRQVVAVERDADVAIAFAEAGLIALLHAPTRVAWHAVRGQVQGAGVTFRELHGNDTAVLLEKILEHATGGR